MFYIQREEDIDPTVSVQLDDEGMFGVVAQTPNVTESEYGVVVVHIVGDPVINGNNVNAVEGAVYLVSKDNGSYTVSQIGD